MMRDAARFVAAVLCAATVIPVLLGIFAGLFIKSCSATIGTLNGPTAVERGRK